MRKIKKLDKISPPRKVFLANFYCISIQMNPKHLRNNKKHGKRHIVHLKSSKDSSNSKKEQFFIQKMLKKHEWYFSQLTKPSHFSLNLNERMKKAGGVEEKECNSIRQL